MKSKIAFVLCALLCAFSVVACESRADKFVRLAVQDYREHNVGHEEFETLYSELSESELKEAKLKIAKELGGDVFAGFFLLAMEESNVLKAVSPSAEYSATRELLDWWLSLGEIECSTSDGYAVKLDPVFGYKKDDGATADELQKSDVLIRQYIIRCVGPLTHDDLSPQKENDLKIALRDGINDNILSVGRLRDVRFMKLDVYN